MAVRDEGVRKRDLALRIAPDDHDGLTELPADPFDDAAQPHQDERWRGWAGLAGWAWHFVRRLVAEVRQTGERAAGKEFDAGGLGATPEHVPRSERHRPPSGLTVDERAVHAAVVEELDMPVIPAQLGMVA